MSDTVPSLSVQPGPSDAVALLADLGQLYNSRLQIDEIVGLVAKQTAERLSCDCVFFRGDGSKEDLHPTAWYASSPEPQACFDQVFGTPGCRLTTSATVRIARQGQSRFLASMRNARDIDPLWLELGVSTFMAAPVAVGGSLFGVLYAVRGPGGEPFTARDLAALESIAPQAARAIANASLLAEERWQRQKAELMFQASKAIHTELNFDQAVREIALLLKQAIRTPWVGVFEVAPGESQLSALRLLGSTAEPAVELRICSAVYGLDAWSSARRLLEQADSDGRLVLPQELANAIGHPEEDYRAFPLAHKLGPQGLLVVCTPTGDAELPAESAEVAAALAELVALAIMNQHLIEQEAKARIQVIRSQAAAQEREVLLRQIVHDLRNATQAMSLVVEDLAIEIGDNPEAQAGMSTLDSQIEFISSFLKEKLRLIQHGDRLANQGAGLADVFADLQGRFGPAARARHQRLTVSPPEPIQVALSAVQLEQIVGNLIDNAIKYTQPGGEVRLRADHSDGWVTIYVSDDGPGIPAAQQARLGEVGFRGEGKGDGAGLGLANVRQLVTQAGGLFGFSSRVNVGTTFHVSLPTTLWGRTIN